MANDYSNVILVDDDERNARPMMFDNRPSAFGMPGRRPAWYSGGGRVQAPARPVYYAAPQTQPTVVYHQAPATKSAGLAGMTVAELIEMGAQVFAAMQPLPIAPVATGELETDVANQIIYQGALAIHAKQDERVRTAGALIGRLLRK